MMINAMNAIKRKPEFITVKPGLEPSLDAKDKVKRTPNMWTLRLITDTLIMHGEINRATLIDITGLSQSLITYTIDYMIEHGLVFRRKDGRCSWLTVSAKTHS